MRETAAVRGRWPLVGREAESKRVTTAVQDPRARGVVVAGPAGVGKTRLAEECVARVAMPTISVRGTRSTANIPLGAFAPYLPAEGLGRPDDYATLSRATVAISEHLDTSDRGLLFVDDAHALDDASAALLTHLARFGTMSLLVTLRTGPDEVDVLRELWKDDLERLDLDALDAGETAALIEAILGDPADGACVHSLHETSQGNPLYVRELVSGLVASGGLVREGGMWLLQGEVTASPRLAQLVEDELRGLTGRELFVLQAIALVEPVGVRVVDERGWGEEWSGLERRGLVTMYESGRRRHLGVAHPLYAEIARSEMPMRRRHAVYRAAADGLAAYGLRRRDDARRVAVWRLEAGERPDLRVLTMAACDARIAGDHAGASRLARAALAGGAGVDAALELGIALDAQGAFDAAEEVLGDAARVAADDDEIAAVALARSDNAFRGLGRPADAEHLIAEALGRIHDEACREELIAQRAMFALMEGRVGDTIRLTEVLVARAGDAAFCRGALQAAMAHALAGREAEAIRVAERGLHVRFALGHGPHLPQSGVFVTALTLAQEQHGAIEEAAALALAGYEGAAQLNHRHGTAWMALACGRAHLAAGRVRTAMRYGREAAVVFGELQHPGTRWGHGLLALAAAQAGEALVAEEAIADLDAEPETPLRMMDTELERARAWTHAARGDSVQARVILLQAARDANRAGLHALEAAALHDASRLGGASDAAGLLAAIADRVDGPLMEARVTFATALAGDDADGLEVAATRFEDLGVRLDAAEAWNEAAIAHRRASRPRPASAAAQRSRAATEHCEGARTPSLVQGTDAALLTRREREVATLASQGLASKEIAEALVVSSRTVENHLQRPTTSSASPAGRSWPRPWPAPATDLASGQVSVRVQGGAITPRTRTGGAGGGVPAGSRAGPVGTRPVGRGRTAGGRRRARRRS